MESAGCHILFVYENSITCYFRPYFSFSGKPNYFTFAKIIRMKPVITIFLFFFYLPFSSTINGQKANVAAIGFYNVENLFDTENDLLIDDEEFLPEGGRSWTADKYAEKSANMAKVISEIGLELCPDGVSVLGLAEIENRRVIQDMIQQPSLKSRNYQIIHHDSPDQRGVDVALIYNPAHFRVLEHKPIPLINMEGDKRRFTRDILYVKGVLDNTDTLFVLVNHWPSRGGGEKQTAPYRNNGARVCRSVYDSLLQNHKHVNMIIMGDLNDNPDNVSITSYLRAKPSLDKTGEKDLYNPFHEMYRRGLGSNAYRDTWSLFDQIIISKDLIDNADGYKYYKAFIFNKKLLVTQKGKYKGYPFRTFNFDNYQGGYSDHFPTYIYLLKKLE